MTPPRLCFLLENYLPIVNGASVHLSRLIPFLRARGAEITVVTRRAFPDDAPVERTPDAFIVRVKPAAGMRRRAKFLMLPGCLLALLKHRRRYDVIVVCDLKVLGMVGIAAAALLGKRCFLRAESCGEVDGEYSLKYRTRPASALHRAFLKAVVRLRNVFLRRADGFISICSEIESEFRQCGFAPSRIVRTTNGIDTAFFQPADDARRRAVRRSLSIADDETVFVYTGRISLGKGLVRLMGAWASFVRERKGRLFIVGGEMGFTNNLERRLKDFVVRRGLSASVTFTGSVPSVLDYLHAADVFVLPSQSEATSLSLLEAMACGLASIVTAVDGNVDIIRHDENGILVPFGDVGALLAAMTALADDPERRRRLAARAREWARERHEAGKVAETYVRLAGVR